ncbi:hypothetical protein EDC01DRAFT_680781 [Geopyxis carbonaria]|nr:hypothetical protein EDC01DRAFT_680781 [Geopyxis carbonaria]
MTSLPAVAQKHLAAPSHASITATTAILPLQQQRQHPYLYRQHPYLYKRYRIKSTPMPLKDTLASAARDEARGVSALAKSTLSSGTYLYPLRGLLYFATHRSLWRPLTSRLIPLATLSVSVLAGMFTFTYVPQSMLFTLFSGPVAWLSTLLLVLSESATIITVLARSFLVEDALVDLFDAVLVQRGCSGVVAGGREVREAGPGGVARLGKAIKKPLKRFGPRALLSYALWLPLNFVPVVGTAIFIVVQGRKQGPSFHERYFQLKGMGAAEREKWVEERRAGYVGFGTAAVLAGLIPGAGVLALYSNTVGAALWAAEMEGKKAGGEAVKGREKEVEVQL